MQKDDTRGSGKELARTGPREGLERAIQLHQAELRRAVHELKRVVRARLDFGRRASSRRWRWLPGSAVLGLLVGRERSRAPRRRSIRGKERETTMAYLNQLIRRVGDVNVEDVLCNLGLVRRRSSASRVVSAFGMVGVGLLVGAGVGLLFAPRSGTETREDIRRRAKEMSDRGIEAIKAKTSSIRHNGSDLSHSIGSPSSVGREGTDF